MHNYIYEATSIVRLMSFELMKKDIGNALKFEAIAQDYLDRMSLELAYGKEPTALAAMASQMKNWIVCFYDDVSTTRINDMVDTLYRIEKAL